MNRTSADLPNVIAQRLNSYVLAASAAGVSVLALLQPSDAEIVYTPANTPIGVNETVGIDLNHDGIVDFSARNRTQSYFEHRDLLSVIPAQHGNNIWGHSTGVHASASALPAGFEVGRNGQFYSTRARLMASTGTTAGGTGGVGLPGCMFGGWGAAKDRYLGLKFVINGEFHYGWARFTVGCYELKVTATLDGYAYETVPKRPIITGVKHDSDNPGYLEPENVGISAPQSGSLGHLAQGAGN